MKTYLRKEMYQRPFVIIGQSFVDALLVDAVTTGIS